MMRLFVRVLVLAILSVALSCGGGQPAAKVIPAEIGSVAPMPLATAEATPSPPADVTREDDAKIPIGADDAQRGSRSALVTIVLFEDFQCPFCGRMEPTLAQIRESYGDDVRFVWKNEPLQFHQHAKLAAQVGQAVLALRGQDAFWQFHDLAFARQANLGPDAIRAWAVSVGVDPKELETGLSRGTWDVKIDADIELAKRIGATGTPASYVNGIALSGAQPFDKWKIVIDQELKDARTLLSQGAARTSIYRIRVAENFQAKPARKDDDDDDREDTKTVWAVPIGRSPVRGNAAAPVTIVEFADFQCPYCKRVETTLEQLRTKYGNKLRFVWKDEPLPFHPRAAPSAELARFARSKGGDTAFWDMHDRLFASQPKLDDADLESLAVAAKLDPKAAMSAVNAKQFATAIDDDAELGDDIQASGTPHFFINGRRLVGAQPPDKFFPIIDEEIAKAEALTRTGVAPAAVYDTIMKSAKAAPEPETKSVPLAAGAAFRGPTNARVVIQEFADFQCPFCNRAEPTVQALLQAYPTQVKVVWRDLPLPMHNQAPLAAEAAREVLAQKGNDGFAKMRKLLFDNQARTDGLERPALESYAQSLGVDMKRFNAALDNRIHKPAVDADAKAANDAGISGTPAFTVGPYFINGAQPLAKFKKLVNRTLRSPTPPEDERRNSDARDRAGVTIGEPRHRRHHRRHRPRREGWRQSSRPLHGHTHRRHGVRQLTNARPAVRVRNRSRPCHQRLGARHPGHEDRRPPQADNPTGPRLWPERNGLYHSPQLHARLRRGARRLEVTDHSRRDPGSHLAVISTH